MNKLIVIVVATVMITVSCQNRQENSYDITPKEIAEPKQEFQIPEAFEIGKLTLKVNPNFDTILNIGQKGTKLHIPQNAFVDYKGNLIKSPVTIHFQEYKNSADMAFSEIPMTYEKNGEKFCFNSSGMFTIQGYADNKEIKIAENKSIMVDYYLAKQNKNIDFYRLMDDSSNWVLINEIPELKKIKRKKPEVLNEEKIDIEPMILKGWHFIPNDTFVMKDDGNRTNSTLLAEGINAGHTYPDIVKGLNVSSFGVYNCDQIYRLPNRVHITAKYEDENGVEIKSPKVLSLIDLNYNGAFSFDPKKFTCDAKGNNVLLLFSESGELFLLEKGKFGKMNIHESGEYSFKMKNVSDIIKNTKDLASYLKIKNIS